jgi:ABC-type sulfate transport system permease subunit
MIELALFISLVVLGLVWLISWATWTVLGCWGSEEQLVIDESEELTAHNPACF